MSGHISSSAPACAVVASEKGVVVGRLQFLEDGDPIDCQRMGVGGKAIPPNTDKVVLGASELLSRGQCVPGAEGN